MGLDKEHEWLERRFDKLWPITRSITGPGFRESIEILQEDIPFDVESIPSGTQVFDWEVPPEWRIREARLTGPDGKVYADIENTNLAVVNYSVPVDEQLTLDNLDSHLYTSPEHPEATPYVTSYYERNWGFCLPHDEYESLPEGEYHAYIDSELDDEGELNFGHTILEGESDREILLSSYLCHPSLANNELSGPLVMASLYNRLAAWQNRKFTYRFIVIPETIGSLTYLWRHGDSLQENLVAGLVLTCLGGPKKTLSYKKTRRENSLIDKVVQHIDEYMDIDFRFRPFDTRGSDERQYCSPGFNLPVGQFARTVYAEYDGYHNSLDTKDFMDIGQVLESASIIEDVLKILECSGCYKTQNPYGEPMMSKRNLYPTVNEPENQDQREFAKTMMRILNYSDGTNSIIEIAEKYDTRVDELRLAIEQLQEANLLSADPQLPTYEIRYSPNSASDEDQ